MSRSKEELSSIIEPPTNTALKHKKLTDAQQDKLLQLAVRTTSETRAFLKPGEGLERVAATTLDMMENTPQIGAALKLDAGKLRKQLESRAELSQYEATAFNLYRRAAENRMAADSDIYGAMLKVNRFVQNSGDAEYARDFAKLSEWVSAGHSHAGSNGAEDGSAPPSNASAKSGATNTVNTVVEAAKS